MKSKLLKCAMTTTLLALFSTGGALTAAAETDVYKDVLRPNGHSRSAAARNADFRACGWVGQLNDEAFQKADACMRARGWMIDHVIPSKSAASSITPRDDNDLPDSPNDILKWDNTRKQKRGDAELQSDANYCDQQAGWQVGPPTTAYKTCMLSRGWRFSHLVHPTEWRDPNTGATCTEILGGLGSAC
jgi:hypothetical protein